MLVNNNSFKQCLSRFPTGVSIITTKDSISNEKIGVTISSLTSLSLDPPLILFCLIKKSHTIDVFLKERYFIANILASNQASLSKKFSSDHEDRWQGVDYKYSKQTSLPVIEGVIAYLECEHYANYEGGDHIIFTGKVINLEILSDLTPLIHYKSSYYSII